MLIIAMPKSASSSLARTLARAHGLDERNDEINAVHPPQFTDRHRLAQDLHPFPAVPTDRLRTIARDRSALRKLHLFPTPDVLAAISGEQVIVLLREPTEIVDAEFRAVVNGIHPRAPSMPRTGSIRRWRAAADRGGLLASLVAFDADWRAAAADRPELMLITHAELTADPDGALRRCAVHLGLHERPGLELLHERWSGPTVPLPPSSAWTTTVRSLTYTLRATARRAGRAIARRVAARSLRSSAVDPSGGSPFSRRRPEPRPTVLVVEAEEHYFLCECTLELLDGVAETRFLLGRGLSPGNRATKDWRVMFPSRSDGRDITLARHRTIFLSAIRRSRGADLIYVQTGPDFGSVPKVIGFWLLCRLRGRRVIVFLHEVTAYLPATGGISDRLRARALRHVGGVVFESEALRAFYRSAQPSSTIDARLGVVRVRFARPPQEWVPVPSRTSDDEGRLRVGLVGGVTHKRRDYGLLAAALRLLDPEERRAIRLVTLGNCTKRRCFEIMDPLAELVGVDVINRHLSEEEFLARGTGCQVLLAPLIDHFAYGRRKGTGAFADATRLARPLIVPADADPLGEFAALTLPYEGPEGLAERLRQALRDTPMLAPHALRDLEVDAVRARVLVDLGLGPDLRPVAP